MSVMREKERYNMYTDKPKSLLSVWWNVLPKDLNPQ